MNQQVSFDPFALWKQFYDKMEDQWSQSLDQSMRHEEFSKWMGQYLNGYLQSQEFVQHAARRTLQQSDIPTKQDLVQVSSLVVNVEEKLDRLEQTVEEEVLSTLKDLDTAKEIKLLKNEMAKLSKRVEQLFDLILAQSQNDVKKSAAQS